MRVSESEGRTMPHERNEERRRGIGFQEVLKSIREPFLTLVFSRNDCSEILEIFFFFPFSLFSFFFFSRSSLLGFACFAYRNYFANFITPVFPIFFLFFNVLCIFTYVSILRHGWVVKFNYRHWKKKKKRIRSFENDSAEILFPTIDSFPRVVSWRAERDKQWPITRLNMHQRNSAWNIPELITESVRVLQKISIDVSPLSVVR